MRQGATEVPRALHYAIESERARLMDAEAILHCVMLALDESDAWNAKGPYYQRVIGVARHMIATTIHGLDSVSLQTVLRYVKEESLQGVEPDLALPQYQIREPPAAYLH